MVWDKDCVGVGGGSRKDVAGEGIGAKQQEVALFGGGGGAWAGWKFEK